MFVPSQSLRQIIVSFKLLSSIKILALFPGCCLMLTVLVTCLKKNILPSSMIVLNCVSGSNPNAVPSILSVPKRPPSLLLDSSSPTYSITSKKS